MAGSSAAAPAGAPARRPGHSQTLDTLRGIAALSVVVFHFHVLADTLGVRIPLYRAGETGVQLFFVLSGFLIGTSVLAPSRFGPRAYALNRSARILPNYFVSILLILVLVDASPLRSTHGLLDLGSHVVLIHSSFRDFRVSVNGVYWTLGLEWIFYIFMLVFAGWFRRDRGGWWIAAALIGGSLVYKAIVWRLNPAQPADLNFWYKQFPGMADQFGCGLVAALLLHHHETRRWAERRRVRAVGLGVSVAAAIAAAVLYNRLSEHRSYYLHEATMVFWPLAFCAAAAGVVLFLQQFESEIGPWLRRSRLPLLGVISYSMYLYHRLVLAKLTGLRSGRGASIPPAVYIALAFVAITVVAAVSYVLVEKPFMDLRRRRRDGRAVPSSTVGRPAAVAAPR